jgi:hypothetical protein
MHLEETLPLQRYYSTKYRRFVVLAALLHRNRRAIRCGDPTNSLHQNNDAGRAVSILYIETLSRVSADLRVWCIRSRGIEKLNTPFLFLFFFGGLHRIPLMPPFFSFLFFSDLTPSVLRN